MGAIFLLSDDMLDSSRIAATARAHGGSVRTFRTGVEMGREGEPPSLVLIDLANPGLIVEDVVRDLRGRWEAVRVIGFGPHVNAAALKAAREAGCDPVLPRSKFFEDLDSLLGD